MAVYLLHIDPPLRHSKHYIGYAADKNLEERIARHQNGTGGVLPREAVKRGSTITLAHVWKKQSSAFERYLKRYGGASRYCPLCAINTRPIPKISSFESATLQSVLPIATR